MLHPTTSIAAAFALAGMVLCAPMPSAAQAPQQAPPSGQAQPQAQPPPLAPPKPYKPVAVKLAPENKDPSLETFRKQLADIAQRKDRAALARLVVDKDFFWERESGNATDQNKSGIENFAAATGLDAKDNSGWQLLADYAAEPTVSQVADRNDFVCAPAMPDFNEEEFEALVLSTETDPGEWGFPLRDGIEVRDSAMPNAKVVETLSLHFVRAMPDDSSASSAASMLRVVTPSGKVGYIPIDLLSPLGVEQLCYIKAAGGWKIAGYVGEGPPE